MLDFVLLKYYSVEVTFRLDNYMETPPLDFPLLASWCFFLEEILLTSLWSNPCFWASEGVFNLSDCCNSALLGPCCRCLWISYRLYNSTAFKSACSSWALINISLSSFRILIVSINSGWASLSLWSSNYSSLICEVSSTLRCTIQSFGLSIHPMCWNNNYH